MRIAPSNDEYKVVTYFLVSLLSHIGIHQLLGDWFGRRPLGNKKFGGKNQIRISKAVLFYWPPVW